MSEGPETTPEKRLARPSASSDIARRRMEKQARRDTKPELALRRAVWRAGLRYRVDVPAVPGMRRRPDLVFTRAKVAVFVDGCFWHQCPQHGTTPKANHVWWVEKLKRNVARDDETDRQLQSLGWRVVRVWEHETPVEAADRVMRAVKEALADG